MPKVFKGVLVELARDDEVIRMMSDEEGKFIFMNVRPGMWKFRAYDYNLPAYHYIQNPENGHNAFSGREKRHHGKGHAQEARNRDTGRGRYKQQMR